MIQITNMSKRFGERYLFKDFNLNVKPHEFIILSGKSGSGKTTLLNIIGGIERADAGQVIVAGIDITKGRHLLTYFRYKVGFLFQNFALIENKTVYQNLSLIKKSTRADITIADALKTVGLEDKLNQKIFSLSGGEQQRVALARLMLKKCELILADEPTGALDRENSDIVLSILKKYQQLGKTICLVTHDEYVKTFCDRRIDL